MISNVTFVNKFVTIVKMFLMTTGTKNGGYLCTQMAEGCISVLLDG